MKVLIEINEERMKDLSFIGAEVLGTEKDMALDTVFTAEDVWKLVANPDGDSSAFLPFDEQELHNIVSFGRKEFCETVITRLNHGFNAEDGVTWYTIKNTAENVYEDLVMDKEKAEGVDRVSTDGLRAALQRYDENGKLGKCGPWEIHDGGYDRWWEIAYEGKVLVACHASGEYGNDAKELGNLERERQLSDKVFSDICKIVSASFQECRMAPEEQKKMAGKEKAAGR